MRILSEKALNEMIEREVNKAMREEQVMQAIADLREKVETMRFEIRCIEHEIREKNGEEPVPYDGVVGEVSK